MPQADPELVADLKQEIAARRVIAIVGAGVSISATEDAPTSSWRGLLKRGIESCQKVGRPRPAEGWRDRQLIALESGDLEDLFGVADQIERRLGHPDHGEWRRWLRESFQGLKVRDSAALEALHDLGIPIATTNYDELIEEVTGLPSVTWRDRERMLRVLRREENAVMHLHGHWQDPASVVLGRRSYDAVLVAETAQALQQAMAMLTGLLFIGCGDGLADPNFSTLREWISRNLAGAEHRHFRLARDDQLASIRNQYKWEERTFVVGYGPNHSDLSAFLRDLAPGEATTRAAARNDRHILEASVLPMRPARCFGRGALVEQVVGAMIAGEHIPLIGPPGIGKSTICLEALHDPRIVEGVGHRRYFVRSEVVLTAEDLLAEIGKATGVPPGGGFWVRLSRHLGNSPAVLALDNLETPWEREPLKTEEILTQLAGISNLALIATIRGHNRPLGVPWREPVHVPPLDEDAARQLFIAVAGIRHGEDRHLHDLLDELDGLSLAIELMAHAAEAEPDLRDVWQRWLVERTKMLARGAADHRLLSLAVSLELSIASPRMTEEARRLLALLGQLPDGIARADLDMLLPDSGQIGAATLRQQALAFDEAGRLRTLAPIREHCAVKHSPDADDLQRAVIHYAALATELGPQCGGAEGEDAALRLRAEAANIQAILIQGLKKAMSEIIIRAAIGFGECQRLTGVGTTTLLRNAAEFAETIDRPALAADARLHLARILRNRLDHKEAARQFAEAQLTFRRIDDRRGEAHCLYGAGRVAASLRNEEEAGALFQAALGIYQSLEDLEGIGNCFAFLGDIAHGHGKHREARSYYDKGLELFRTYRCIEGEANCLGRIGDLEMDDGNIADAELHYQKALPLLRSTADVRGQCVCLTRLAAIALSRENYELVKRCFTEALPLSRQIGDVLIETHCLSMLDLLEESSKTNISPVRALEILIWQTIVWAVDDPAEKAGYLRQVRESFGAIRSEADFTLNVGDKGQLGLKLVRDGTGYALTLSCTGIFASSTFVEKMNNLKDRIEAGGQECRS